MASLGWQRIGRQQMAQIKGLDKSLENLLAAEPLPGISAHVHACFPMWHGIAVF